MIALKKRRVIAQMGNKQKVATIFMAVLVLSTIQVIMIPVNAEPVPKPGIVDWLPGGQDVHASLKSDPEWLKVWTATHVSHTTWIHVLGKDTYGQNVEAKVEIPESTPPQSSFVLIDVHSGFPVTFAKITDVYQQGGEHCNIFQIHTYPYYQMYLGLYHLDTGYEPTGAEPWTPDPLKVIVDGNLVDSTITIKGLDQNGNPLEHDVTIPANVGLVTVDVPTHTWSAVCTVMGGEIGISYYIYTHPKEQRAILQYKIAVDHIEVTADPKNILADGESTSMITITLLDQDGHEVHWAVDEPPVEINVAASGGRVTPSVGILIEGCNTQARTMLTSDTNPRIVRVTALAIVPETIGHPAMQLFDEDIVCFDGINSVPLSKTYIIKDIGGTGSGRHYAVFIRLNEGCNLISIPVVPDEALTWDMLPCAGQCLTSVATFRADVGMWLYYDYVAVAGDSIPIVDGWGYWVKAEKPCTLVISGRNMDQYDPDTGFGLPPMYPMAMGWNFVGVTSIKRIETASYLESLKYYYIGPAWGPVWVYRNGLFRRNPLNLLPCEGLWLFTYDGILAP